MKVFTCNSFKGHYPVPTGAVVVAEDKAEAIALLNKELKSRCLPRLKKDDENKMVELDIRIPRAVVLCDGNY